MSYFTQLKSTTVTIASGASLSGAATIEGTLVGILMPAAWDAAQLTFQSSPDGLTYADTYTSSGTELITSGAAAAASRYLTFAPSASNTLANVKYIKVRSGPSAGAVTQSADRVLTLVYRG